MSGLFNFNKNDISILDPGAGTGILTAAACETLVKSKTKLSKITVDIYENDPNLLPYLKRTIRRQKTFLKLTVIMPNSRLSKTIL